MEIPWDSHAKRAKCGFLENGRPKTMCFLCFFHTHGQFWDDKFESSTWHSRYFPKLFPAWVPVVEAWRACHEWESSVGIISFAIRQSNPEPGLCDWISWDTLVGRILLVVNQIPFNSCDVIGCLFMETLNQASLIVFQKWRSPLRKWPSRHPQPATAVKATLLCNQQTLGSVLDFFLYVWRGSEMS